MMLPSAMAQTGQDWEITGNVTAGPGPLKGAKVIIMGPASVPAAMTDGRGTYSLKGAVPGRYTIGIEKKDRMNAPPPRSLSLDAGMRLRVDFTIPMGAVISGRVLDRDRQPVRGFVVRAMSKSMSDGKLRLWEQGGDKTNDLGEYRIPYLPEGAYVVAAADLTAPPVNVKRSSQARRAPAQAYPPITFHPGTHLLEAAAVLELHPGDERPGVDIVVRKEPAKCVSFQVGSGFTGARIGAGLKERVAFDPPSWADGRVAANGEYEVCGVPAGEYRLTVISIGPAEHAAPGGVAFTRTMQVLSYAMPVVVVGREDADAGIVEPLALQDVQGTVTVKDGRPGDSIPAGVLVRIVASELRALFADRPATVQKDGSFVLRQVFAGEYGVRVDLPAGYYLAGAYQQGRDVSNGGFHPGNGDLQISLGADGSTVAGRVLSEDGAAIPDASVFLVPRDPRPHLVAQSDQTGTYRFAAGVRPGEYRLAAVANLPGWQRTDAAIAARLAGSGIELKLDQRQARKVDLKGLPTR